MVAVFDHQLITIIFILGGPGAGKGTQSSKLVKDFNFIHLSAGDLLRSEQIKSNSKYSQLIKDHIKNGQIVPMQITLKLLENSIRDSLNLNPSFNKFLIDGFPRQMDQAIAFDQDVCQSSFVLFLTCSEKTLLERLLERGKTSGRDDDNPETIKKRFHTFVETSMPVIEHYQNQNKVIQIDSDQPVDVVYQQIHSALISRGIKP